METNDSGAAFRNEHPIIMDNGGDAQVMPQGDSGHGGAKVGRSGGEVRGVQG